MRRLTLSFCLVAVFCSGAASLVYQVCWTRRLSEVTSATVYAQAIVLAIFFAGLALGSAGASRLAGRSARPLLGYATVEVGALTTALLSIVAFGVFDHARAALSLAGASPSVALAVELVLAGALLLIPTTLMGASLPFVLEATQRARGSASGRRVVGLFYGINTLGAAAGAALAGFILIERVGLARTTVVGAALSLGSALIALSLARSLASGSGAEAVPAQVSGTKPIAWAWLGAAALGGFIGVGAEVVWTRLFSLLVLNTVYAFTQVLIAVLLGIALGAWLAQRIARHTGNSPRRILRAVALAQAGAAIAIACVPPLCLVLAGKPLLQTAIAAGRSPLGALLLALALAVPVMLNAATLPLLVYALVRSRVSRSFGALSAANTAGSIAGSLGAGFVLLPALGTVGASMILEAASILLAVGLLWVSSKNKKEAFAVFAPGVVVVVCHVLFPDVSRQILEARVPDKTHILELREGVTSDVMVTEAEGSGQRRIWINSSWVAGTGGGHRVLGYLPALFVPAPQHAVGIALGTGQTFAAVFANGVSNLDVVEINPDVIRLSRHWFAEANHHLFERPGVHIHQDDGRVFLRATREQFDLIVLEPLQAWSAGTSSLYSREFYEEARARLAPGGLMAQWIPFYGQGVEETRAMVRTAADVFPNASLWLDEHDGILLLRESSGTLSPAELDARIAARGLGAELRRNALNGALDVFALLGLGPRGIQRWTEGAALISDDRPFLEFAAARQIGVDSFDAVLRSMTAARDDQRPEVEALAGSGPIAAQADAVSRAVTAEGSAPAQDYATRATLLEQAIELAPSSALARHRYRRVMEKWGREVTERGASEAAIQTILRRGVDHDDGFGEATLNLAVLALRHADTATARTWLERAAKIDSVKDRALQMLAQLGP